jgi:exonuclease VII large subunit
MDHLSRNIALRLSHYEYALESSSHRLDTIAPALVTQSQQLSELKARINIKALNKIEFDKQKLLGLRSRIQNLDPIAILHRGFAIVEKFYSLQPPENNRLVTNIATVQHGDNINVTVSDGAFKATVISRAKRTKPKDPRSETQMLNLF